MTSTRLTVTWLSPMADLNHVMRIWTLQDQQNLIESLYWKNLCYIQLHLIRSAYTWSAYTWSLHFLRKCYSPKKSRTTGCAKRILLFLLSWCHMLNVPIVITTLNEFLQDTPRCFKVGHDSKLDRDWDVVNVFAHKKRFLLLLMRKLWK